MKYPYAQIDEAGLCVAVSSLSEPVDLPGMIELSGGVNPLGKYWTGAEWTSGPDSLPRIVIIQVDAGEYAEQTRVAKDFSEVDVPVGATLAITAELRHGGELLRLSDSFRMPVTSTDGREKVVIASMDGGTITLRIPVTESRVWRVTQDTINRNLPAEKHMAFAGLTVYAIEA